MNLITNGDKIEIVLTHTYPVDGYTSKFTYQSHSEFHAKLMAHNLREGIELEMRIIRQQAYNEGWKNSKAKTRKKQVFSSSTTKKDYVGH